MNKLESPSSPGLAWLDGEDIQRLPSPNFDERPPGEVIRLIVIHAISLPPGQFGGDGIERLFTNRLDPDAHPYYRTIHTLRVSSHFLIRRSGKIVQFVACDQRAWHAGRSIWRGRERCNDFSIGIELEGCDNQPFEAAQYDALQCLLTRLREQDPGCATADITGHSDIAPRRKTDPGPCFDWTRIDVPTLRETHELGDNHDC